jgi:hypothetical protein
MSSEALDLETGLRLSRFTSASKPLKAKASEPRIATVVRHAQANQTVLVICVSIMRFS